MRTTFVMANWKMHKTSAEAQEFLDSFLPRLAARPLQGIEVGLAPPFTALPVVARGLQGARPPVELAGQNTHFEREGAFTGEISAPMLRELGCRYAIVGHSERRALGEDDTLINKKLKAAYENDLVPLLCVGESLQERNAGQTEHALRGQLEADLDGLTSAQVSRLVVAYEPVWAIGTGETASPADAEAGARFVREVIARLHDQRSAEAARVQYGGSVNPDNTYELMTQPNVDGALVGGASLDPDPFAQIVLAAEEAATEKRGADR